MSDNTKIGFKDTGCGDINGVEFQRPHFVCTLMNVRVNICQLFNHSKLEIHLINIKKFSFYLIETQCVSITKTSQLILFREIADYCENLMSGLCGQKGRVF
jgi:hypothetical protein